MLSTANKAAACVFLCGLAVSFSAESQVVERGRTLADLIAVHPCDASREGRIARVTDCDAADDIGDGEGAFNCWASCDGSAPWVTQAIGGGGGLPGAGEVTEAMLKAVDTANDEEVLTYETTTGDFEWQVPLGGSTGATDDKLLCSDGAGGSTLGVCTVGDIDNLRLDGNTIFSTTGNINLYPAGAATNIMVVSAGGVAFMNGSTISGGGGTALAGFSVHLFARTQGVGAPLDMTSSSSSQWSTNEGATAEVYVNLPGAAGGLHFTACVQDADGFRYTAATGDTIRVIDKVTAAAGYISSTTIGSCVTLTALNATEWFANSINGTWTDGTFTFDNTSLTTP